MIPADDLPQAVKLLLQHSNTSFLYMRSIFSQIGAQNRTWTLAELQDLPANLDSIFELDLARVYDGLEPEMRQRVEDLLSIMMVALEPMRPQDVADLMVHARTGNVLQASDLSPVLYRLQELVELSSSPQGGSRTLQFLHQSMREWLFERATVRAHGAARRGGASESGASTGAAATGRDANASRAFLARLHAAMAERCVRVV